MQAAVMRAEHAPLEIEDVKIDRPGPHEVLTRTVASGICHSDLHVIEGGIPMPVPCVLGHEPAGIVEEVGSEVRDFQKGDHVIGCLNAWCGSCEFCLRGQPYLCMPDIIRRPEGEPPRLSRDGESIMPFGGLASFAEYMLTHERALVKIRDDMPLDRAALIGCGVTTGLGAALRTARVEPGSSVAIIGCGGVGLSALQGSRIAGAGRIVAVDNQAWKLELARDMGATDAVDASEGNPVEQVQELLGGGVDYAFECIGLRPTIQQAVAMLKKGGAALLVGVLPGDPDGGAPGRRHHAAGEAGARLVHGLEPLPHRHAALRGLLPRRPAQARRDDLTTDPPRGGQSGARRDAQGRGGALRDRLRALSPRSCLQAGARACQ